MIGSLLRFNMLSGLGYPQAARSKLLAGFIVLTLSVFFISWIPKFYSSKDQNRIRTAIAEMGGSFQTRPTVPHRFFYYMPKCLQRRRHAINSIDLTGANVDKVSMDIIASATDLAYINLSKVAMEDGSLVFLQNCRNLRGLGLS